MYALKIRRGGHVRVEIMLSKRETEVMNTVYEISHEKGVCLISPAELLSMLPAGRGYTEAQVEEILNELALDNYFELLSSERKGEKMFVISLRTNGYAFKRCFAQMKRDAAVKMLWAVASAIVAFLVGVILKRIF